ncbi:MAG TPA: hypothetical protein VNE39_19610 [Planctomycetota bacterium]|nr:hypothetical protein [Planctomycetota bacterium]
MTRLALAAAILSLLSQAESLAGSPVGPLVLDAHHRAEVDERGVWRLEAEKGTLLAHCGLRVWAKERFETQSNARPSAPPSDGPGGRAFAGTLRCGQRRVEYWQTLTPVPGGLLVQYAVAAGELAETEEVAACFELPLPTFANATFTIEPGKPVSAPAEKAAEPRLLEQDATTLVVERDGRGAETPRPQSPEPRRAGTPRLQFQRRPTGKIIVQDARHWGNPWIEVQLYARRSVGDPPGWRSVSFLVSVGKPGAAPVIAAVVPGKPVVPCHEVHEAEVHLWAAYENPYDPAQVEVWAEVVAPSGARPPALGFFTRDYVRSQEQEAERLTPVGLGSWRLRITPTEPGAHVYVVKVKTPGGTAESKPLSFSAAPSTGQRFLRAPRTQSLYLEHANGEPCFLIGHNYCWPPAKQGTYAAEAAFARMAGAGINATRLWLCTWGIRIEGDRPDDYRLDDAWRLDHLLRTARERGLYVQLCLDNFQDLAAKERAGQNPYLAQNGGPCQAPAQFFQHPKAIEQHRRRLRYLAARYAPFTSVLAWELFNEVSYASDTPHDPAVLAWTKGAAGALRKLDPHGHPVTISLGLTGDWDDLWRAPELDIVQLHTYIPRPTEGAEPRSLDAAALVLSQKDALEPIKKPILIAEFGFLGTRDFNPLNEADTTGVHLHSALWASALGGCAGTAMHWWWDSYVAERDLYYHYAALASFVRAGALPGPEWVPIRSKAGGELFVLGSRGRDAAVLWVRHRDNTWYRRVVERRGPVAFGGAAIEVPRLAEGRYRVEWWDTYAGQPITHATLRTSEGTLVLRPPERFPDVACRVTRLTE